MTNETSSRPTAPVEAGAQRKAAEELAAFATLLERPPLGDVEIEMKLAVRIAASIRSVLSALSQPGGSESGGDDRPSDDELLPHLPDSVNGAKRCGIQRSVWLDGWFIPWSPRNDNENAEGPWSDWVNLARKIIEADEKAIAASTPSSKER
jgi:hypothetical protein